MLASIAHFLTNPVSPPVQIPIWLVWIVVALFNLLVNARLWADWRTSYRGTRLETALRKVNAVCLLTWPVSGFVFLPVFFGALLVCGVGILLYHFGRALVLAASRTLPDAISVLSGEKR